MRRVFTSILLLSSTVVSLAQYAPAADKEGTTAMSKDSSVFVAWAANCTLNLGYQNIANTSLGRASVGNNTMALGKSGANGVVSLGDGGVATVSFSNPVVNGKGNDFAVFENGFSVGTSGDFLELAFVEVSSDGQNFVRFPSVSKTQISDQVAGEGVMDATKIYNLAGKYVTGFGTPFDLEELKNIAGLNVNNITHVRIVDVVGSIQDAYSTKDSEGNIINDPWPTPFASSGFDLDAVGVINSTITSLNKTELESMISLYPNPIRSGEQFKVLSSNESLLGQPVQLMDMNGQLVMKYTLTEGTIVSTEGLPAGIYLLKIGENENQLYKKLIIGM